MPEYTARYDAVVHLLLRKILEGTKAPKPIHASLKFGKASILVEYTWNNRRVKISAGIKHQTDPLLYHNRPDITIHLTNPDIVYVYEIAISHIQNLRIQEKIKRVRYEKNSSVHVTHENYNAVPRSHNLREALSRMHRCPVKVHVMVFGALGEVLQTEDFTESSRALKQLGITESELSRITKQCSLYVCNWTSKIIVRRMNEM